MILTGTEIKRLLVNGDITIDPFDERQLNPNSYNLCLAPKLKVYTPPEWPVINIGKAVCSGRQLPVALLDCRADNPTYEFEIPEQGFVIYPGKLYLGSTVEYTATEKYVPMLDGRSSLARLGISVHQTGGFGDIGFRGRWTIEISCVEPVRIYAGLEVCQIRFQAVQGETILQYDKLAKSKYANQVGPTPSLLFRETTQEKKA
jgi:dCTP deaminase